MGIFDDRRADIEAIGLLMGGQRSPVPAAGH